MSIDFTADRPLSHRSHVLVGESEFHILTLRTLWQIGLWQICLNQSITNNQSHEKVRESDCERVQNLLISQTLSQIRTLSHFGLSHPGSSLDKTDLSESPRSDLPIRLLETGSESLISRPLSQNFEILTNFYLSIDYQPNFGTPAVLCVCVRVVCVSWLERVA